MRCGKRLGRSVLTRTTNNVYSNSAGDKDFRSQLPFETNIDFKSLTKMI